MDKLDNDWAKDILNLDIMSLIKGIWYTNTSLDIDGVFKEITHDGLFSLEDESWWFKHRNKIIATGIARCPPSERTIVDVGGGNGFVTAFLETQGFHMILFEPGIQGTINAQIRGLDNLVCAPLNSTTVKPESIASIGLYDVLEHIDNDEEFLNELYLALKPDGMMYITVPAHMFLWSNDDEYAGHFRRYNIKNLCKVLTENGFEVLFYTHFFRLLPLPIFIFRTLPYKFFGNRQRFNVQSYLKRPKTANFVVPRFIEKIVLSYFGTEAKKLRHKRISSGASIFMTAKKRN